MRRLRVLLAVAFAGLACAPFAGATPTPAAVPPPTDAASLRAAYQRALVARRLEAAPIVDRPHLQELLARTDAAIADGRSADALGELFRHVEAPGFKAFERSEEGRQALVALGELLVKSGAEQESRATLARVLVGPMDLWSRRAVRALVDLALASADGAPIAKDLAALRGLPPELAGDVAYLRGRLAERRGDSRAALAAWGGVGPRSRYWAQAVYLSALAEANAGRLQKAEQHFCRVADPKRTPREAPLFGGRDFFEVRDLARLGLGRVAHERYRFDDARYYYHLVPRDSDHLPEALYEAATGRYEAKDYDGARRLLAELAQGRAHHPYEDEAYLLGAWVELARCRFDVADAQLKTFLQRYEPALALAKRLQDDGVALQRLVLQTEETGDDAATLAADGASARTLRALLRSDPSLRQLEARRAQLLVTLGALKLAEHELAAASAQLGATKAEPNPLLQLQARREQLDAALAELRRLLREASASPKLAGRVPALRTQLAALELRADALRVPVAVASSAASSEKDELKRLIAADRQRTGQLAMETAQLVTQAEAASLELAKAALGRVELRLRRLVARARLGRIETVLGRKRALEVEVEALAQGLLPRSMIDSLDAARFLRDDEEFWPQDGEDWRDEYIGGEGLR